MPWFAWVVVVLLAASAAVNVLSIGKRREPITPGVALAVVVTDGLCIWAIVELATR